MAFSRNNALDQVLDIQGSFSQSSTRVLSDEVGGLGAPLTGQTGAAASITTVNGGAATVTGLAGMSAASVGNFLTISGAASLANNGTFMIVGFTSASSVDISNGSAVAADANNAAITWSERRPYCLNDDLDFERTDRAAIKGVGYAAPIPTYERPTALGTPIAANLANIAGNTLDARGFVFSRQFEGAAVASGDTFITVTSSPAGGLKHSDSVDKTGVPCIDVAPYVGDYAACYVQITNSADGSEFEVITPASPNLGNRVFGVTRNGTGNGSPDSVEIQFRSVPLGGDLATSSVPYTWEAGQPATPIDLVFGFFERLDLVSDSALRTVQTLGIEESSSLRADVTDIQAVIGMDDGETSLTGLTGITASFPFADLLIAHPEPSVTDALNALNEEIGDRVYTGSTLANGDTVTESLQALSSQLDLLASTVAGSGVVRFIERLAADVPANTSHALPGIASYTPDPSGNGLGLSVYTRGVLRDPGSVINGNDYAETDSTHVTFYSTLKAGDHINYLIG